jgi:hypothetical protein
MPDKTKVGIYDASDSVIDEAFKAWGLLEQRTRTSRANFGKHNEDKRQKAKERKQVVLKIAAGLGKQKPKTELAKSILRRWPKQEEPAPGLRTIRRWLALPR